ncbi:hypothetical protein [Novipirellula sp.]|uniref:hypothetical protein n=1 Tax=Novipirellula sp. TaxID=2795430 RepID=UPI00356B24CB
MPNLITGTEFEKQLRVCGNRMTDREFRRLVFAYCQHYQEIYWFDQLENAFAYLELASETDSDAVRSELTAIRNEVECAMGEYFESLNEVATAINRLLDERPFTTSDTISCISHVWNAHACNEAPAEFRSREDRMLCKLLVNVADDA